MYLYANVRLELIMRDGETEEAALDRLYKLLYDGVCNTEEHNCDFWIENASFEEG